MVGGGGFKSRFTTPVWQTFPPAPRLGSIRAESLQVKTENAITFYCKKFGKHIFNKVSYWKVLPEAACEQLLSTSVRMNGSGALTSSTKNGILIMSHVFWGYERKWKEKLVLQMASYIFMLYPLYQVTDGYLELPNIIGNFLFLGHTQIHHYSQLCLLLESLIIAKAVSHNDLKLTDHTM